MIEVNKDNVSTAEVDDLRAYGRDVMGKNFPSAMKPENIRKAVAEHLGVELTPAAPDLDPDGDDDGDGDDDTPVVAAKPAKQKAVKAPADKREGKMYATKADAIADKVTIMIPIEKGEGGSADVFTGWNGINYLIQRGKEVDIPYGAYLSLMNAVSTEYDQQEDGSLASRDAETVPVRLVRDPKADKR